MRPRFSINQDRLEAIIGAADAAHAALRDASDEMQAAREECDVFKRDTNHARNERALAGMRVWSDSETAKLAKLSNVSEKAKTRHEQLADRWQHLARISESCRNYAGLNSDGAMIAGMGRI